MFTVLRLARIRGEALGCLLFVLLFQACSSAAPVYLSRVAASAPSRDQMATAAVFFLILYFLPYPLTYAAAMFRALWRSSARRAFYEDVYTRTRGRVPDVTSHHAERTFAAVISATGQDLMADCAHLLALAAETAGTTRINWRGVSLDPSAEPERLGVIEAFECYAGLDLAATLGPDGETDRDHLARQVRAKGGRVSDDDTWADLFSKVLATEIEPKLGQGRATFLCDYPAAEAALARRKPGDARLSERFELYACGVELANAFGELTDPEEQRRRFIAEMDEKDRVYGERYPIDEDFLAALAHMPPAAGAALGFDRLVMLAAGAPRIEDVLWTPVP